MKLKVCGVRNMAMVQACQDAMVDYIGFNFVPTSARVVDLEIAQNLSHAFTGKKVGVFMDQSVATILETISVVDLDIIQLHGNESPEFIASLKKSIPQLSIWKAFSMDQKFEKSILQHYSKKCDKFLFDGKKPGSGAQIVNSNLLSEVIKEAKKIGVTCGLAGGVNANSIPQLLTNHGSVVFFDTASGVETNGKFKRENLTQICSLLQHA